MRTTATEVESLTALVEHADGRLELIDRSRRRPLPAASSAAVHGSSVAVPAS
jgi:hypothetical protein